LKLTCELAKGAAVLQIRSLIYFLSTLETCSFTATAQRFGVAVPTVSASIAQLEASLSHPVLLRTHQGVLPAQAAGEVAVAARRILCGLIAIETGNADDAASGTPDLQRAHGSRLSLLLLMRFLAVREAGSIGGGARLLRVTQPQVSRQIAELETLLGRSLFDRLPQGTRPNAAADALYPVARALCERAVRLVNDGNRLFVANLQTTRIGSVPPFHPESNLARLLADICQRWSLFWPGTHLTVASGATDWLIDALMAGNLHAAIVETDEIPAACESATLLKSVLDLVVGGSEAPGDHRHILTTTTLVLQGRASGLRRKIDSWLEVQGIVPGDILEVDAMPVIGRLIARPGYCSLIPRGAHPVGALTASTVTLPDPPFFVQRLIWRREQAGTRPVRRLLQLVETGAD
jgi:DNA-binding transcriptional LysR family regulator